MTKLRNKFTMVKENIKTQIRLLNSDNRGMGVIEIVLIILVLVGLVILFRDQITGIINSIFSKVTTEINNF